MPPTAADRTSWNVIAAVVLYLHDYDSSTLSQAGDAMQSQVIIKPNSRNNVTRFALLSTNFIHAVVVSKLYKLITFIMRTWWRIKQFQDEFQLIVWSLICDKTLIELGGKETKNSKINDFTVRQKRLCTDNSWTTKHFSIIAKRIFSQVKLSSRNNSCSDSLLQI